MFSALPWMLALALAGPPGLGPDAHREPWAPPLGPPVASPPPNAVVQVSGIADPLSEPEAKVMHGAFAPDGKKVAVAVEKAGMRHIELRDWTGSVPPLAFTTGEGTDDFPCWTPGGDSIVYQSARGPTTKLYMMSVSQRREVALTFGPGDDMHPRVSHSGRYVAFDSNRSGNSDIWLLDLQTGKLGQVTDDPGADFYPCWSPDDRALAFTSARTGKFEIWAQRLGKGRQGTRITYGPGHQAHPDWSSNGWIAYDSDQMGQTRVLMTQPASAIRAAASAVGGVAVDALVQASGAIVTVTDGLGNEEFPRFSHTGRHLLVQNTEGRFVSLRIRKSPVDVAAQTLAMAPAARPQAQPVAAAGQRKLIVHDGTNAPALVPGGTFDVPPVQGVPTGAGLGMQPAPPVALASPVVPPPGTPNGSTQAGEGLRVLDFFPHDEQGGVPIDTPIAVIFNRGLDRVMEPEKAVELRDGTEKIEVVGTYNPVLNRLDMVPRAPLLAGTQYVVIVHGTIRSQEGSPLGNDLTYTFRTSGAAKAASLSTAEFRLASVLPGRSQHGVSQQTKIEVRFTQPIAVGKLDQNALKLTDESGKQVLGELFAPPGDTSVTLTPYKPLEEGRMYRVTLGENVKSASGAPLTEAERVWEFHTISRKPFAVVGVSPAVLDGPRPRVRVRFTKGVDLRTVARGRMTLEGGGESFGGRVSNAENGEVLIYEPYQSLPAGQVFTVALPAGITDEDGNPLKSPPRLTVKTRPGRATTLLARGPDTPPILGLGKAAGASKQAPRVLQNHGMPEPGKPIITQYFGPKDRTVQPPPPGAKPGAGWVYQGLRDLARRGFLGEGADANKINAQLTRWKLAQMVNRAGQSFANMDLEDRQLVRRLQKEFAGELASQGFDTRPRL